MRRLRLGRRRRSGPLKRGGSSERYRLAFVSQNTKPVAVGPRLGQLIPARRGSGSIDGRSGVAVALAAVANLLASACAERHALAYNRVVRDWVPVHIMPPIVYLDG